MDAISGLFKPAVIGFLSIMLKLDIIVYGFISSLFKIFMSLAGAKLLTNDAFMTIANKLYMIVGVVMLFVLSYGLVRAIINPDEAVKGELGGPKIVKGIIIAVVGLAVTPVVFELLYKGQSVFIENDVLGALFFRSDQDSYDFKTITIPTTPSNTDTGSATNASSEGIDVEIGKVEYNKEIKNIGGSITATYLWQAFFRPDPKIFTENYSESAKLVEGDPSEFYRNASVAWGVGCVVGLAAVIGGLALGLVTFGLGAGLGLAAGVAACGVSIGNAVDAANTADQKATLDAAYALSSSSGDFDVYFAFLPNAVSDDNTMYNGQKGKDLVYTWGISTIVGLFVCYCFLTFSIDLAVRAAKLAYYQIIAPIPLILQIVPKFQKTWKDYISSVISTFLEVFIRISVVYIITYFICHLGDVFSFDVLSSANLNFFEGLLANVIMILGLVAFARNAPKLISETFGLKSGSLDFGIRKKLADGGLFSAGAIVGSAATGLVRNANNAFKDNRAAGYGRVRSGLRAARSAIGGAGSAAARTTYSQFFAPNHHEAHDFREMRDSASRAAEEASNARIRRRGRHSDVDQAFQRNVSAAGQTAYDNYLQRNPGDTAGADTARRNAEARAQRSLVRRGLVNLDVRTQGMRDSMAAWAGGTVDTSEWDNLMSLESKLEGARNKIVDTVSGKDNSYKDALKLEEELRTPEKRREIAYEIEARRKALIRAFKGSSDATEAAIAHAAEQHDFDALINRFHVFDGKSENFTAAFKSNASYASVNSALDAVKTKGNQDFISFADFNVGDETELGNITRSVLRAKREAAGLGVKNAQAEVAARYTASYALFGVGNDVTDEANRIFNELQAELRKNRNATFKGVPLEQYIRENFGEDALATGTIDYDTVLSKTIGEFKFDAKGNSGNYTITYTNTKQNDGTIKTTINVVDENNNVVPGTGGAGFDLQHLKEFLKSDNATQNGQGSSNVTNSGAFTQMKSDATDARRDLFDDPAYRDARTRQQRQRERQQNNNNGGH